MEDGVRNAVLARGATGPDRSTVRGSLGVDAPLMLEGVTLRKVTGAAAWTCPEDDKTPVLVDQASTVLGLTWCLLLVSARTELKWLSPRKMAW